MNEENLIPFNRRPKEFHREASIKGGKRKTPRKALASRINGMLCSTKLSNQQKYMFNLLRDKRFTDLIMELLSYSLQDIKNPKRRDKLVDQLLKFLPSKNINLDVATEPINFNIEEYQRFKEAVLDVCSDNQIEKIRTKIFGVENG